MKGLSVNLYKRIHQVKCAVTRGMIDAEGWLPARIGEMRMRRTVIATMERASSASV
jgi:hypothetical protein